MKAVAKTAVGGVSPGWQQLGIISACLLVVLGGLFLRSFIPSQAHFSNDAPLGALSAANHQMPDLFSGGWADLNTIGASKGSASPSLTYGLLWLLGPLGIAKAYAPIALLVLGFCAWFCFRQLGLTPLACVLGALAATLNSSFFSVACWGIAAHTLAIAMTFLAIGLLAQERSVAGWLRAALAGMAVGMGVMEGADLGAMFSVLVAAFVVYQTLTGPGENALLRYACGVGRLLLVVACALFIAAAAVYTLIQTAIVGVAGTGQDTRSKAERWDFATQWSLPKVETLQFSVPGLFGYRMDTPGGGNYWGAVGRDPNWDRYFAAGSQGEPPQGFLRQTGGGLYAGILVLLVGAWAAAQGFRGKESVFALSQRRWLWFWSVLAGLSLLIAWGRFAPFYQILYAIPYASTMRSPVKFAYFVEFAAVVLFAYGIHGLNQRYMQVALTTSLGPVSAVSAWWKRVRGFDRQWAVGCLITLGVSALALLLYASSRKSLIEYLTGVQLGGELAESIASFSFWQAGVFIGLLALAMGIVLLVISGWCAGHRARIGAFLLGGFLLLDLGRANLPWIIYLDWQAKYATNPVIEFLRQKPWEQRVVGLPFPAPPQLGLLGDLYRIEWAQHHFQYYNIQSLDIVQMPRMPEDLMAFETAWRTNGTPGLLRRWELTNTRYLLGPAGFAEGLNSQLDPVKRRFSIKLPFDIGPKPEVSRATKLEELTAVPKADGPYAVIEFNGVLPRAKLFSQWSVNTNDAAVLQRLFDPAFNPQQEVIVNSAIAGPTATNTNAPGTVEFVSYASKHIVLKADVKTPAVLLLNDRFDANWTVRVDDQPAPLLRANFIMRAVRLEPGVHTVEFQFRVPEQTLYVSLAAIAVAILLCGLLALVSRGEPPPAEEPKTKA